MLTNGAPNGSSQTPPGRMLVATLLLSTKRPMSTKLAYSLTTDNSRPIYYCTKRCWGCGTPYNCLLQGDNTPPCGQNQPIILFILSNHFCCSTATLSHSTQIPRILAPTLQVHPCRHVQVFNTYKDTHTPKKYSKTQPASKPATRPFPYKTLRQLSKTKKLTHFRLHRSL